MKYTGLSPQDCHKKCLDYTVDLCQEFYMDVDSGLCELYISKCPPASLVYRYRYTYFKSSNNNCFFAAATVFPTITVL